MLFTNIIRIFESANLSSNTVAKTLCGKLNDICKHPGVEPKIRWGRSEFFDVIGNLDFQMRVTIKGLKSCDFSPFM